MHADSFVSSIRLFHVSWGMESRSTATPGAIGPDFVTDENLSEGNANETPPLRPKNDGATLSYQKKRNVDEEEDNTDPYVDSESDAESVQFDDLSDGEISQKSARPRKAVDTCGDHDVEHCEPKRFDLGDFDSEYKLDNSKEKYVKKFFTTHLSDERINASVLDIHPVSANNFLNPPEVDAYIEDLVNDKRAFKFLQDQALKHVQRKVSRCLGHLAEIWEELDGA